jgi:hypothetical protein
MIGVTFDTVASARRSTRWASLGGAALNHVVMVAENMFNLASFIEQDFGNTWRQTVAIAHATEHRGEVALCCFLGGAEKLPLAIEKPYATVRHRSLH